MSVGEALAQARRRAGLTVSDISERTRIRESIIKGIERDDYSACGGDFYARGHIRALARAAGADSEPFIEEYDSAYRMPSPDPAGEATGQFPAIRPEGSGAGPYAEPLSEIRLIGQDPPAGPPPSAAPAAPDYDTPGHGVPDYGPSDYTASQYSTSEYEAPGHEAPSYDPPGYEDPGSTAYPGSGYDPGESAAGNADYEPSGYDPSESAAGHAGYEPSGYDPGDPAADHGGYEPSGYDPGEPAAGHAGYEPSGYEPGEPAAGHAGYEPGGYEPGEPAAGHAGYEPSGYDPSEPAAGHAGYEPSGYAPDEAAADGAAPGYPAGTYPAAESALGYHDAYEGAAPGHDVGGYSPHEPATAYPPGGYGTDDPGGYDPDEPAAGPHAADYGADEVAPGYPDDSYPAGHWAPDPGTTAGYPAGRRYGVIGDYDDEDEERWTPPAPDGGLTPGQAASEGELAGSWGWSEVADPDAGTAEDHWHGAEPPAPRPAEPPTHITPLDAIMGSAQAAREAPPSRPAPPGQDPEQVARFQGRRPPQDSRPPRAGRAAGADWATRPTRPGRAPSTSTSRPPGSGRPGSGRGPGGPAGGGHQSQESRNRRGMGLIALVLLVIIGVAVYLVTSGSNSPSKPTADSSAPTHPKSSTHPSSPPATPSSSPPSTPATSAPPAVLHAASASAFGPGGVGDGDNQDKAGLAIDHAPGTSWASEWYSTSHFGNLKNGTGLLLNMGHPVTITSALINLGSSSGADLQLRVGSSPTLAGLHTVATANNAGGTVRMSPSTPATGRYVLVWFTMLPPDSAGTYQARIFNIKLQ